MPKSILMSLIPVTLLLGGCVAGTNDRVDTQSEIEATIDSDIDGDGTVSQNGVEVGASG